MEYKLAGGNLSCDLNISFVQKVHEGRWTCSSLPSYALIFERSDAEIHLYGKEACILLLNSVAERAFLTAISTDTASCARFAGIKSVALSSFRAIAVPLLPGGQKRCDGLLLRESPVQAPGKWHIHTRSHV